MLRHGKKGSHCLRGWSCCWMGMSSLCGTDDFHHLCGNTHTRTYTQTVVEQVCKSGEKSHSIQSWHSLLVYEACPWAQDSNQTSSDHNNSNLWLEIPLLLWKLLWSNRHNDAFCMLKNSPNAPWNVLKTQPQRQFHWHRKSVFCFKADMFIWAGGSPLCALSNQTCSRQS